MFYAVCFDDRAPATAAGARSWLTGIIFFKKAALLQDKAGLRAVPLVDMVNGR